MPVVVNGCFAATVICFQLFMQSNEHYLLYTERCTEHRIWKRLHISREIKRVPREGGAASMGIWTNGATVVPGKISEMWLLSGGSQATQQLLHIHASHMKHMLAFTKW